MSFQSPAFSLLPRSSLVSALAVSLLLHLLLLWPEPAFRHGGTHSRPLAATLRTAATDPGVILRTRNARTDPDHVPEAPAKQRETPPRQSAAPVIDSPVDSTAQMPRRSPAVSAVPDGRIAAAGMPEPAPAADETALDADGVREYRLALATQARRYRNAVPGLPDIAAAGRVEVRVAVTAGGVSPDVQLARSSGLERVDELALDLMRKAAPTAVVPQTLRQRAFAVNLLMEISP